MQWERTVLKEPPGVVLHATSYFHQFGRKPIEKLVYDSINRIGTLRSDPDGMDDTF